LTDESYSTHNAAHMQRLTETQVQFLSRLGKSPDGQLLLALINSEIDAVNIDLRRVSGEALYRLQGRAASLDELADVLTPKIIARREPFKRPPQFATDPLT
jgi:hypothetical protein